MSWATHDMFSSFLVRLIEVFQTHPKIQRIVGNYPVCLLSSFKNYSFSFLII